RDLIVTGVQTCALPISERIEVPGGPKRLDFGALDAEALEVGRRIFRIEDLAVEEGLLAARLRRRDIGRRDLELLGGLAPKVFARSEERRVGKEVGCQRL